MSSEHLLLHIGSPNEMNIPIPQYNRLRKSRQKLQFIKLLNFIAIFIHIVQKTKLLADGKYGEEINIFIDGVRDTDVDFVFGVFVCGVLVVFG